jgi:hypothetical protein
MNGISRTIRLATCVLILAGCQNTKTPTLGRSSVDRTVVNRTFDYQDPNPDTDAGPWVERPRGFERPRAVPRRVDETRATTDDLLQRDGAAVNGNPSVSRYPNSVTP